MFLGVGIYLLVDNCIVPFRTNRSSACVSCRVVYTRTYDRTLHHLTHDMTC